MCIAVQGVYMCIAVQGVYMCIAVQGVYMCIANLVCFNTNETLTYQGVLKGRVFKLP